MAIVSMAHALGHKTVAEGIETPRQHTFLQQIGCDKVQGFLFGRPMPAAALETWERERAWSIGLRKEDRSALEWRGEPMIARRGSARA